MERVNQYAFYDLGAALKSLAIREGDTPVGVALLDIFKAREALGALLNGTVPLGISSEPCNQLVLSFRQLAVSCFDSDNQFQFPPPDSPDIPGWHFDHFRNTLGIFETVFSQEMRHAAVYSVPQRGIFDTPHLIDRADLSFPDEIGGYIPEGVRDDWKAAGRCLAFNLFSASGFHVARATEGMLEVYYRCFLNEEPRADFGWGDYLSHLEQVSQNPAPDVKTLSKLRQMKDDHRNPLIHPRETLNSADARVLFSLGEIAIISMGQEILTKVQSGMTAPLTLIQGKTVK